MQLGGTDAGFAGSFYRKNPHENEAWLANVSR
jgi:hypothetical protein